MKIAILVLFLTLTQLCRKHARLKFRYRLEISKGDFEEAYKVNFNDSKWDTCSHDWAIYGPFDKNVDKQSVAIVQNGEI
jgi:beta-galactosidase